MSLHYKNSPRECPHCTDGFASVGSVCKPCGGVGYIDKPDLHIAFADAQSGFEVGHYFLTGTASTGYGWDGRWPSIHDALAAGRGELPQDTT